MPVQHDRVYRQRRWAITILVTAALLLSVHITRTIQLGSIQQDWDALRLDVDSTQAAAIAAELDAAVRMLRQTAMHCDYLAETADMADASSLQAIYDLLDDVAERRISYELRDSSGTLLRYSGYAFPPTTTERDTGLSLRDGTPYTILTLESTLGDDSNQARARLLLGTAFRVTVPVNRRFLSEEGLLEKLAQRYDVDLRLEPLPLPRRPSERVYVPFTHEGQTLAVLSFEGADLNAYLDETSFSFHRVLSLLFIVFLLLLSFPLLRICLRLPWALPSILLLTLYCWLIRYALLWMDVPAHLLPAALMDPATYGATFGGGLVASPGELLVSSLILLLNALLIYVRMLRDSDRRMRPVTAIATALLVAALFPLTLRAAAAILHSFVIDSSFNYDDVGAVFDNLPHVLMIISTWMVTLSHALLLLSMYLLLKRATAGLHAAYWRFLPVGMIATGMLLFLHFNSAPLLPGWVYAAIGLFFVLPSVIPLPYLGRASLRPATPFLVAATLGSALAITVYSNAMEAKRSAEIEAIAMDLSRPVDAWSHVLLEQTLQEISRMRLERNATPVSRPAYETAFRVWSASPLSRLQNNSAVLLIDSAETPVSRFAVGNDPFLLSMHTLSTTIEKTEGIVQSVYRRLDDREKRYYKGYTDVATENGRLMAVVVLEALDPMQISHNAVDLLRSTATTRSLAPEDHFIVSRFINGHLFQTTEPLIERGLLLPQDVTDAFTEGRGSVWSTLPIGDESLHSFFVQVQEENEVLSITRGASDTLLTMYRWLRFAFLFSVLSLAGAGSIWLLSRRFTSSLRHTFARKLQLALLAVAAIPLLLIWIAGRDFVLDMTQRDMEQQVTDNLEVLRSNILTQLPDTTVFESIQPLLTDQLCQEIRLRTGKDVNVFDGIVMTGTSKPELYHTGLLNNRLNPAAWEAIVQWGRDLHVATEQIGEFSYYVGYRALRDGDGRLAAIISTPTLFERNRAEEVYIRASAAVFLWITLLGIIVLLVSTALSQQISRPLSEFISATRDITDGNLDRKVRVQGSAEFVDLMTAFNTMTERLRQSQAELAAAERELAWKEMARQVAHEIRNPLTPMKLSAQHLQRAWRDRAANLGTIIDKVTHTLIDQIDSLSRISDEFARFGRMPRRTMGKVEIERLLSEAVALFHVHENIRFELDIAADLPMLEGDREELARALTNLLRNSVQAITDTGLIAIHARADDFAVHIRIEDNGIGIPPELLPRIFEPNFSTKTEGMGLGLAIVKKIIDDARGTIRIESEQGKGSTVFIQLPLG